MLTPRQPSALFKAILAFGVVSWGNWSCKTTLLAFFLKFRRSNWTNITFGSCFRTQLRLRLCPRDEALHHYIDPYQCLTDWIVARSPVIDYWYQRERRRAAALMKPRLQAVTPQHSRLNWKQGESKSCLHGRVGLCVFVCVCVAGAERSTWILITFFVAMESTHSDFVEYLTAEQLTVKNNFFGGRGRRKPLSSLVLRDLRKSGRSNKGGTIYSPAST